MLCAACRAVVPASRSPTRRAGTATFLVWPLSCFLCPVHRSVLADGVAYAAKNLNPSVIIDIATLTGAQGIATGRHFAALYCNSEELEAVAVSAGKAVGEMTHPLPYAPEFFQKEFASSVADMKNSVKDRANASSSCAGQFIGSHMSAFVESKSWLHVDIAYPSFAGERATGFGAALLTRIVADVAATMV